MKVYCRTCRKNIGNVADEKIPADKKKVLKKSIKYSTKTVG